MDLRQLEYFVAVAEELSFTRAAARCRVAQSALSHQVCPAGAPAGVVLFERTSRAARSRRPGSCSLPRASDPREVDETTSALAAFAGVLTWAAPVGGRRQHGKGRTCRRAALPPSTSSTPACRSPSRTPGAGTWRSRFAPERWTWRSSGCSPIRYRTTSSIASWRSSRWSPSCRGSPAVGRSQIGLAELADEADFVEMRSASGLRIQVDAAFARAGVQRSVAFALDTSDAVARYVGLGLGVAVVPASTAAGHTGGHGDGYGDVTALALDDPEARHPVSLVHRRPEPSAPAARAFLALLPRA